MPAAPFDQTDPAWTVLDALDDGIYTIDPEGNCLFVNKAALRILGYDTPADLLGRNMHDMIHHTRPDGSKYPRDECPLIDTARGGHTTRLANETLWRRDRTPLLAEYSAFALHRDGKLAGSIITFREEVVRENARTRLAVQYAVSQVLTGSTGVRQMIERVLETVVTGFGWDAGRYWKITPTGLQLMTEWPLPTGGVGSAEVMPEHGLGARAWASRRAVHETSLFRPLGPIGFPGRSAFAFPVGAGSDDAAFGVMELFCRRIVPSDPSLLGAVENIGHLIGQTLERFRVTASLRDSENRFRVIADAIPQLSWMTDAEGNITWYNQRWYDYTGTTFEEMAGWGWKSVHDPEHLDRVVRGLKACFDSGEPWEDTFPLRGADGEFRWFLSRALPIHSEEEADGPPRILGWFGSNTDITAMRDAEQSQVAALDEAEAANLAKSLFLANMSHELRTPLSAIIGYSEMLIEEVEDGADTDQVINDVRKIESNARHLLGLINDVLDLSKVESGKMEAFAETFNVTELATDVAATVATLVEKNGNTLDLHLGDALGSMHSDVTRIRQMLLNLLSNAAKFTSNGRITLAVSRQAEGDAETIRFAVTDTGLGMTEEQLAKLFQRFQQADASTTRKFGGTGLGLSLTRVFSHLLGGEVDVTSVPNRGSTFTLTLPVTLPAPVIPQETAPDLPGDRDTVLVIDDDQTQRELASRFLERTGFAPVTAPDGATGLLLARDLQPHAILLDVTMPGLDGWSVLNALKADPATAEIPVIMVSLVDAQPLADSLGAADYVMKPVEWDRLRNVLDRFREAEGDVLIIDDDTDLRARMRRILEAHDWSVSEAANGAAAMAHIDHALPRVILLDLNMPKMDGFEFLKLLRERPGCGTVPVVVLSAKDLTLDDRRRLRGADQVLNKSSISLNELADKLRTLDGLAKT
ncbi:MAG: response regulator [Janthinobacterium lividum]